MPAKIIQHETPRSVWPELMAFIDMVDAMSSGERFILLREALSSADSTLSINNVIGLNTLQQKVSLSIWRIVLGCRHNELEQKPKTV